VTNSTAAPLPAALLEALARHDTPTICNALEIVAPERRLIGYTRKPLVCPFPDLPPMYVRALYFDYTYTTEEEYQRTGNWWNRYLLGSYFPAVSLP